MIDAASAYPPTPPVVLEMGFDAVLLNTAVARADDPVRMASAFAKVVAAGRLAYQAGAMAGSGSAQPSTLVAGTPFWQSTKD